jgi:type IV secretion system protein TrbB
MTDERSAPRPRLSETQTRRHASLRTAVAPIQSFLSDDSVVEIMLNADGRIWVEKAGVGMLATDATMSPEDALRMLRVVATEMNSELSERNPSLAGKLPIWGARVQASIPPIVEAPVFALRKPAKIVFGLDDYVSRRILSPHDADALREAVRERRNILVGGGTGSGKTTFANALLREMADSADRIYLVEDNPELQCAAANKLQVLVQPPTYTWNRAIMDAMRFRPDRIIVGEIRDGSALEMLKAWNTGHPGGIATVHANDTGAMLDRVCQLIEEVVPVAPRGMVADTVDVCVHLRRDPGHPAGRSVTGIDEVHGISNENRWILAPLADSRRSPVVRSPTNRISG